MSVQGGGRDPGLSNHFLYGVPRRMAEGRDVITSVFGLSRMEGLRERDGDGHTLSRQAPPPPRRLSRKGGFRAGSSINAPLRDNRGGGGGLVSKGFKII